MKTSMIAGLSGLTLLGFVTSASAAPLCDVIDVQVQGHTLGAGADVSATYRRLKVATDQAKTKLAALKAWQAKVKAECPGNSPVWGRASNHKLDICDQAMGGQFSVCASAKPHTKGF